MEEVFANWQTTAVRPCKRDAAEVRFNLEGQIFHLNPSDAIAIGKDLIKSGKKAQKLKEDE